MGDYTRVKGKMQILRKKDIFGFGIIKQVGEPCGGLGTAAKIKAILYWVESIRPLTFTNCRRSESGLYHSTQARLSHLILCSSPLQYIPGNSALMET